MLIFQLCWACFWSLKKQPYKKLFKDINEVEKEVITYFSDDSFKKTLMANFKETLGEYKIFYEENKSMSFNNFDD